MAGILNKVFPSLVWNIPTKKKVIYLTFDDGPNTKLTPFILQELAKYNAKATFFLLGKEAESKPSLHKELLENNHSVGNHTFSHPNGWITKNSRYYSDVEKCSKILNTKLFRPPYGKIKPSQIWQLRKTYKIIMWDVLSWDFHEKMTSEKCFNLIKKKTKNGSIIVFHENDKALENVTYCLPKTLKYFSDLGYQFKAIEATDL